MSWLQINRQLKMENENLRNHIKSLQEQLDNYMKISDSWKEGYFELKEQLNAKQNEYNLEKIS